MRANNPQIIETETDFREVARRVFHRQRQARTGLPAVYCARISFSASDAEMVVAEIDGAAARLDACFEQLPDSAQASVVRLGQGLSRLRSLLLGKLSGK